MVCRLVSEVVPEVAAGKTVEGGQRLEAGASLGLFGPNTVEAGDRPRTRGHRLSSVSSTCGPERISSHAHSLLPRPSILSQGWRLRPKAGPSMGSSFQVTRAATLNSPFPLHARDSRPALSSRVGVFLSPAKRIRQPTPLL